MRRCGAGFRHGGQSEGRAGETNAPRGTDRNTAGECVGEGVKKEGFKDREAERIIRKRSSQEIHTSSNSVDDARRLYVRNKPFVRTNVRVERVKKNHRAEEGSALFDSFNKRVFQGFSSGKEGAVIRAQRANQERPPTDAGPARKALVVLDLTAFCVNSGWEARSGYMSDSERVYKHHRRARDPPRMHVVQRREICV